MIQPTEESFSELGHPMWKRNAFAGFCLCLVGIAMMVSVVLFVYGAAVLIVGFTWAVIACVIGMMQERAEMNHHHLPHA